MKFLTTRKQSSIYRLKHIYSKARTITFYSTISILSIVLLTKSFCYASDTKPVPDASTLGQHISIIDSLIPTDQTRPEVFPPQPIRLKHGLEISGDLDLRYRTSDINRSDTLWIQSTEIDSAYPITDHNKTRGKLQLQIIGENPPDSHHKGDVHIGEAYVLYKLPSDADDYTAYVKVGQFQVPFGLLAVYDPHLLITQPLYSQSLGIRTDWGIALSGKFYNILNYDFAITRGSGPNAIELEPRQVVTFRLGRTFFTRNGTVNVGGSLLTGHLPITDIDASRPYSFDLPPSGEVIITHSPSYIDKTRIAGDGTLMYHNITARGEAMAGADSDKKVLGYYAEGEYRFSKKAGYVVSRGFWRYPVGDSYSGRNLIGVTYFPSDKLTARIAYEMVQDKPQDSAVKEYHRFTTQLLLHF